MAAGSFDSDETGSITEINITPFVDVVLVLLVIFMVTAPMMMRDVLNLKLPSTKTSDMTESDTMAVVITKNGQFLMNGELSTEEALVSWSQKTAEKNPNTQVVIAADLDSRHESFVRVVDIIRSAGLFNFAIQVEKQIEKIPRPIAGKLSIFLFSFTALSSRYLFSSLFCQK